MAIETVITSDALLKAIQSKKEGLPERFSQARDRIGSTLQQYSRNEAPFITHNLQRAIHIDNPDSTSVRVFPDDHTAPYALFVILGHKTRPRRSSPEITHQGRGVGMKKGQRWVTGNPFFDRAERKAKPRIDREVAKLARWLSS